MASKQSKKATKKKAVKKKTVTKKKVATKKKAVKKVATKKAAVKKTATKRKASKKAVAVKEVETKKAKPAKAKAAPKKRKKRKSKTNEHYVNGKEFYEQIKEYYRTDDMTDILAESINKIATGLSFAPNFINYTYKDDMVGDAVLKMFLALKNKKFNVDTHNNPFSYFTTIAFHAFINRIKKEKKHRDTITRYQETVYGDMIQETTAGKPVYTDPGNATKDE